MEARKRLLKGEEKEEEKEKAVERISKRKEEKASVRS